MSYFIGTSPNDVLESFIKRYFYGLRRNTDGELFLNFLDQAGSVNDSITINDYGDPSGNFNDFEEAIDYVDGITETHDKVYANLRYPQFRWDARYFILYVNEDGELVMRINQGYSYPEGISSPGY